MHTCWMLLKFKRALNAGATLFFLFLYVIGGGFWQMGKAMLHV